MGVIRELPELVANKIAAGEVIERPASVVKELVENAIDAGASRVEIQLEEGGKRLVRVTDNGSGMDPDDAAMCFRRHATSKLRTSDDLFFITTLGFRGEALPSVGAVARARLVTRPPGAPSGTEVEVAGGRMGEPKAAGAPQGTTVEVRDLFFNTPARQKFLRSPRTELGHVMDMVMRIALPHEQIHFVVSNDGKTLVNAPPAPGRRERVAAFVGADLAAALLPVAGGDGPLAVEGLIAPPDHARGSTAMQFLFLNRRYVRDRALAGAIRQAYEGLLPRGRFPALFLFLQMDPREADFNVHPTKIEVRFRQGRRVFACVLDALRSALAAADLAPPLRPSLGDAARPSEPVPTSWDDARGSVPVARHAARGASLAFAEPPEHLDDARTRPRALPAAPDPFAVPGSRPPFFQVHDTYIVEETAAGFRVTDQHALHERVLYEELLERSAGAGVESQRLLMPEVVALSPAEAAVAAEVLEPLRALGLEAEAFGENTLAVHAVPRLARDVDVAQLVHDLLAELAEGAEAAGAAASAVDAQRQRLARALACKAAVKAGDRLRESEIEALLARRGPLGPKAESCPHGRPTSLVFSLADLERQFKRK
ncbi:MAG TPA: DNA mismatch repair endonuclease MutL [Planctomycetota bacterium]|nr:DNA mismatch repair endonuclease MutL [Planctomycetota bacterium]